MVQPEISDMERPLLPTQTCPAVRPEVLRELRELSARKVRESI